MRVLIIEDETSIVSVLKKGLEEEGHYVMAAYDGEAGLALMAEGGFDLVILDIILPRINGWEVCQRIRLELKDDTPILMLSALNQTEHIVKGLKAGADDYLAKPFKLTELLARMEALRRRYQGFPEAGSLLSFADLKMDLQAKEAWRGDRRLKLTAKEFNLLHCFMLNPNKVLSRQEILEAVWGVDFDTGTNVVDVYVNYLRNKMDKNFEQKRIHTVFGMGYVLKDEHDAA
jgi:DNA-binding response OmpR family regulator